MNVLIEPMTLEDLDTVAALERASFQAPWSRSKVLEALRNPTVRCWVARCGPRVVGYCCVQQIGTTVDVVRLATHPLLRRRGVGRLLLAAALEDARALGVKRVTLLVRTSNVAAIGLYRAFGFRVVEWRPGYYADGEDALVMALEPAKGPGTPGGAAPHHRHHR